MTDLSPVEGVIARIRTVYSRWTRNTTIQQMRQDWAGLFTAEAVEGQPVAVSANGVAAEWMPGHIARKGRAILFLHGGGYQIGTLAAYRHLAARIAMQSEAPCLLLDYRQMPEHRYPAAVQDALAAYRWLLTQGYAACDIAIVGDSAGGNLALALLLSLRRDGDSLPAACALLSPWTDMTASSESYETRAASDPIHQRKMMQAMARNFLGDDVDPRDPLVSPLFADLSNLPPLLVQVGDREVILDDSRLLVERAQQCGGRAELQVWDDMIHVFQAYPGDLPEARQAIADIGAFLRRQWTAGSSG